MAWSKDFALYQKLEDEFECSGMCRKALFYFSRTIEEGRPQNTCMTKLIDAIRNAGRPMQVSSGWASTGVFFLFIMHFFMYHRSYLEESDASPSD